MTIQTAVLIETLQALGAQIRWASCNIFSTRTCAAAIAVKGIGVRSKGESLEEYWDYTTTTFEWPDNAYSNMILDDGGDATLLLHLARAPRRTSPHRQPASERRSSCSPRSGRGSPAIRSGTRPARAGERRDRGDHHRRAQAVPDHKEGTLPSGDQRQRLGHEEQVRQISTAAASHWWTASSGHDVMIAGKSR